jgi:hypothetical protein
MSGFACASIPQIPADYLRSGHVRCIVSAPAEIESVPRFLAAILWVSQLPIRETKSHPHLMSGLAGASIRSSLLIP